MSDASAHKSHEFDWMVFSKTVGSIAGHLGLDANRGDAAHLRRAEPGEVVATLYKYIERHELGKFASGTADQRDAQWSVVLQAMATLSDLHTYAKGKTFGAALAEASVSELRFMKLSRARGDQLATELRATAQRLAAKKTKFDQTALAWLVLSDARSPASRAKARRGLARDYFSALRNPSKNTSD